MSLTRIQPSALDQTLNYTANTFTANYITFGDGTTQTTAGGGGSGTDAFARTQANTANLTAISAYAQANSATIIAQAAYAQSNTATTIGQDAFSRANSEIIGTAAYVQANTATNIGTAAYTQANTTQIFVQASFDKANSEPIGTAAFNKANSANTLAQTAFDRANSEIIGTAAYVQANTATTIGQAAYGQANNSLANTGTVVTTNSLTQFKFANTFPATSNTTGSVVISGGLGVGANLYANTIFDILGEARTIIQNPQSGAGSYTLVAADAGKHIYVTGTGGVTCPVSVFTVGQAITIVNNTAASITITAPSAGTLYLAGTATTGNRTLAQRGIATLIYVIGGATPTVISSGAGLT